MYTVSSGLCGFVTLSVRANDLLTCPAIRRIFEFVHNDFTQIGNTVPLLDK